MPAARRSDYDAPAFRRMWYSPATLEDMAEKYGVKPTSILKAGRRRHFMDKRAQSKGAEKEMAFTHVVKNSDNLLALYHRLGDMPQPFTASIVGGEKRSNPQNNTIHMWYAQVGKELGDQTDLDVRAECKLRFGVPILRRDNAAFGQWYDETIRPLDYETKLRLFLMLDPAITSTMTKGQLGEYMDAMMRAYSEAGVILTDPSLQGYDP